ncbi:MAG: oligosaccharide flippase family protein [Planctomycetota bacterium]
MSQRKLKVIALSAGNGLAKVIQLLVVVIMARVLLKEDLAAYRQTFLAYLAIGPILSLGVGQGMYYFLPSETERVRGRVSDGVFALSAMGILFGIFIGFGGNEILARGFSNPQVARMLLWMIPYAIVTIPASATESVLVARDRVLLASVFGVIRQLLVGFATLIPLVFWQTADAPLVGNVAASVVMGLTGIGLMYGSVPSGDIRPNLSAVKELLFFTVPIAAGGMLATLSNRLDQLIVSVLCSPDEFAVYVLGAMEIPLIGIVTGAITSVTLAEMRKSVVDGRHDDALQLFRSVGSKSSLILLPIMFFLLITSATCIEYLYTSEFRDSVIPFRIYLLLLPIRTVVFGSLLISLGLNRFLFITSMIGLILNAIFSSILVIYFNPWGAVVATVTTIYIWNVPINIYQLSKNLNKKWWEILPLKEMGQITLHILPITLTSLLITYCVDNIHLEFGLIVAIFACFLLWYWNGRLYSATKVWQKLKRLNWGSAR